MTANRLPDCLSIIAARHEGGVRLAEPKETKSYQILGAPRAEDHSGLGMCMGVMLTSNASMISRA